MMIKHIFTGFVFGIAAGLSPGPLLALLISETIRGHKKNGILVSTSPVITDIPVLLVSMFIINKLKNFDIFLSLISIIGAIFLFFLGIKHLKLERFGMETSLEGSLKKAILLNILNPYTYMFWFFIGAPYVLKEGAIGGIPFLISFFVGITGSMFLVVIFTEKLKAFIESRYYIYLFRLIGFIFILFSFFLLKDGIILKLR